MTIKYIVHYCYIMVGSTTRSQARFSREKEMARGIEINKSENVPLVRLKNYKIKARSFDIKLNGPFDNQLRSIFNKFSGHSGGRNTRERVRGINNLVNNRNLVIVSENKLELQKQVKFTFVPSSDFMIEDITQESASANQKKKDGNNNAVVRKNRPVDNGQASNCDGTNDTSVKAPKWAREPALTRSLRKQQKVSPDSVFAEQASIRPVDLALMFPQSAQERDIWNSPPRPINYMANINNED